MDCDNNKRNLIRNPKFDPAATGVPEYFHTTGPISYDQLTIKGYHTCSLTMTPTQTAGLFYDPLIRVRDEKNLEFGMEIRSVDLGKVFYVAEFLDEDRDILETRRMDVTSKIDYYFDQVAGQFLIPRRSDYVRLSVEFQSPVTACTFWAPYAFFL